MNTGDGADSHGSTNPCGPGDAPNPQERTPWLMGFLCLLIPILPSYSVAPGPLKSNGSPARLIAVVLFGLVVLGFLCYRRATATRTVRPGVVIILVYFFLIVAIYGVGLSHSASVLVEGNRVRALISLLANVGVALYIMTRVQTMRQRTILLGCLAVGLSFTCLVGLLQSVTAMDLRYFFQPPGFVLNSEFIDLADRGGAKRVIGTAGHAIEFAALAAVAIPLTLHFARFAVSRQVRWLAALGCVLALVAMPAAVSRTGLVALAAMLLVYVWSLNLRQLASGALIGLMAVGSYVAFFSGTANALWQTVTGSREDVSVLTRTSDYAQVSQTFRAHPVFGLGLGGTPTTEYGILDTEWLQSIAQGGVVGVMAMIVLVGGAAFGLSAGLRCATSRRERDQVYVVGAMAIGILSCSFTFDLFAYNQITAVLFISLGLLWSNFVVALMPATTTASLARGHVTSP
jgi:O-antigen ligase